jgi:hypothetical protein
VTSSRHVIRAVLLLGLGLGLAACIDRPVRFADRLPVLLARDEGPSPLPVVRGVPEAVYLSEVYLHRPIREALDLSPYPECRDVNSMDDVVRSSWYEPPPMDLGTLSRGPESDGPPQSPFAVLPAETVAVKPGLAITDARGLRYEIGIDPPDRREMRTAAVAIAARLVWTFGQRTPPAFVIKVKGRDFWKARGDAPDPAAFLVSGPPKDSAGYYRVSAVRFPAGLYLGQTPESGVRGDDSNDLIAHTERRTLRALQVLAAWIRLSDFSPAKTLDVYEGEPGRGHVVHYLTGLDDALGSADVARRSDPPPAEGGGPPGVRLVTLGLWPNPPPPPTQTRIPSLGEIGEEVDVRGYRSGLPYQPTDRILPGDGYWVAKRIAAIPSAAVALAIDAGWLTNLSAERRLFDTLEARRAAVIRAWYRQVTPLEVVAATRTSLVLRDEAISRNVGTVGDSSYRVELLDEDGKRVGSRIVVTPRGDRFLLALPPSALEAAKTYLIVRVLGKRKKTFLPRPCDVHVKMGDKGLVVLGIRH